MSEKKKRRKRRRRRRSRPLSLGERGKINGCKKKEAFQGRRQKADKQKRGGGCRSDDASYLVGSGEVKVGWKEKKVN